MVLPVAFAPCALAWSVSLWWAAAPWLVVVPLRLSWWHTQREILARYQAHTDHLAALTARLGVVSP